MSLLKPKTIEELILKRLVTGPKKTTEMLSDIDSHARDITKQGFYAAVRKLKIEEVVVLYRGMLALNTAWIRQMDEWVGAARNTYLPDTDPSGILALKERESLSYTFADTKHLDAFWGHTQNILVEQTPAAEPVYSYDPHYWFYIARKETELRLIDTVLKNRKQFLMTVGEFTPLDKVIRADFSDDDKQYHLANFFEKKNYYVVIIGDYITEVSLDPKIAEKVDVIYGTRETLDAKTVSDLEALLTVKARHKIKISRNARKAAALKSKLGKNFFIRK